ncbi:MAG: H-NS histone family protein [Burkholderiaceae bacterium]|nr:H-NS histone family protein [Burkholderiaceae bacterium]
MSDLADLIAQKAALEQRIAEARREARAGAIAQIKALMAEHGLTLADLAGKPGAAASAPRARTGGKVPPKYRDPATGTTWSGRGLHPKWLKAALASGRKLSDFAI